MLGIADSVIGIAGKVLDKFVEDKDLKKKLDHELRSQIISLDLAQAQANVEQAKHVPRVIMNLLTIFVWQI